MPNPNWLMLATVALATLSFETEAWAQYDNGTLDVTGELGYARVGERDGVELGIGGRYGWNDLRLSGVIGGFVYANEDDRFRSETLGNGNTVCRDTSNGQFSDSSNCAADVSAYGKIEAAWAFDNGLEIGVGGRFTEDLNTPFGTLAYRFGQGGGAIYATGGDDYIGIGIGFRR